MTEKWTRKESVVIESKVFLVKKLKLNVTVSAVTKGKTGNQILKKKLESSARFLCKLSSSFFSECASCGSSGWFMLMNVNFDLVMRCFCGTISQKCIARSNFFKTSVTSEQNEIRKKKLKSNS